MDARDIDKIDVLSLIGGILTIAYTTPMAAILVIPIGFAQYYLRRSQWFEDIAKELDGLPAKPVQFLLPPPKEENTALEIRQDRPLDVRVTNVNELPFWERIRLPADADVYIDKASPVMTATKKHITDSPLAAIQRLPKYYPASKLPDPPTHTSVPVGIDSETKQLMWVDMSKDFIHGLIAGQTGTGKDALLRLWYVFLTTYNTPQEIQFVILDGKNEWMMPALAQSPYMLIPPAGGVDIIKDEKGRRKLGSTDRMAHSLDRVFDEIEERQKLFLTAGASTFASYQKKTGKTLPRIIIIATDVGEDLNDDLEMLVRVLTMKARSFGINLIISMQTSSKQDTGWRSNLSLVMSGHQSLQSADQPVMGMNASMIRYRPSQLPNPEETDISKGLFAVRKGAYQTLVRTPHLTEEIFEDYIEASLQRYTPSDDDLLVQRAMQKYSSRLQRGVSITPLDLIEEDYKPQPTTWALTQDQRVTVINWRKQGWNKSQIMKDGLKLTNSTYYSRYSDEVDKLIDITDRAMRGR